MRGHLEVIAAAILMLSPSCASTPPLTLKASPMAIGTAAEVHFFARYTGVLQPARIEWSLCRVNEGQAIDMASSRPIVVETWDTCTASTWPTVQLRDEAGRVIARATTDHPIQVGASE